MLQGPSVDQGFWGGRETIRAEICEGVRCEIIIIINLDHSNLLWCYRRILKISWIDTLTNEKVLEIIGTQQTLVSDLVK